MNYKQLSEILEIFKEIPETSKRDRAVQLMLQTASDSINFETLRSLLGDKEETGKKQDYEGTLLKLTEKEISKMPTRFRKEFLIGDRLVRCRRRKSGKNTTNYEIRYRKHGYNIAVSSNNLNEAIEKFIKALHDADCKDKSPTVPATFQEFAAYYFETYRKRKVTPETFKKDMCRYDKHIKPYFNSVPLKSITPLQCQRLLDGLAERGLSKTNNEVYSLLNGIFKMAVAHGIINANPLSIVIVDKHNRKHGTALSKEEEKKLLESMRNTKYEKQFAVALYTGLRPNEFKTAEIKGDFIVAVNSKRKNGRVEYKKIPICKMLKPYLIGVESLHFPMEKVMRQKMNKILPNHILYDLRTTFYTRCEECGVADAARDEFVGHSRGELNNAYADLSDEYLLNEGKKLVW